MPEEVQFTRRGSEVFRDFVTEGNPGSGAWNPRKDHIRQLFSELEGYVEAFGKRHSAIATTVGGIRISEAIVSTQAFEIETAYQTPTASTVTVRFKTRHGLTTGDELVVRVDAGMHGLTKRAHPAQGEWTVTVIDEWEVKLDGSTWAAGSIFIAGHAYVPGTVIDAAAELNALFDYLSENGGGYIKTPPGVLYIQSAMLRIPSVVVADFRGSAFILADGEDHLPSAHSLRHMLGTGTPSLTGADDRPNVSSVTILGGRFYGNRGKQQYLSGRHAIDLGGDTDLDISLEIIIDGIEVYGSGGYGMTWGGANNHQHCAIRNSRFAFPDTDGIDLKNRLDANLFMEYSNMTFEWTSMGDQGTDLAPTITLPTDAITTVGSGAPTRIRLPRASFPDTRPMETVTIMGAATVAGADYNGSHRVTTASGAVSVGYIELETGITNNTATTGGGSGMTAYAPKISVGDPIIDLRGAACRVDGLFYRGELFNRNGVRQRGGIAGNANGEGGTDCLMNNIHVIDLTPAPFDNTPISSLCRGALSLTGVGGIARGLQITTSGIGISFEATAVGAQVSDFHVQDAYLGVRIRGDDVMLRDGFLEDCVSKSIEIHGATAAVTQQLDENPFSSTEGSTIITVAAFDHGRSTGNNVQFSGAQSGNGVTLPFLNDNLPFTLTVVDANTYTIDIAERGLSAATGDGAFGGTSVTASYGTASHTALRPTVDGVTIKQSAANSSIGISVGKASGFTDGRVSAASIRNCRDISSNTPYEVASTITDTDWGPGNSGGLPNNLEADLLSLNGVITPTALSGNVNNYAPTNGDKNIRWRLDGGAASRDITGIGGGSDGAIRVIRNIGSNNLVLKHASTSSTAANRFALPSSTDVTIAPGGTYGLLYDGTLERWVALSQANVPSGTGDVVGPASVTDSHFAQFDGPTGKLLKGGLSLDTDGTFAANSASRVPSQSAVKTYADGLITALKNGVSTAFDTLAEIATELALKATIASPTFTGTPAAPTAAEGTSTTQIATTAFVQNIVTKVPQNSKSAAYTTVLADAGKHILHPASDNNARTFTIDSNANVAYPIGTTITFINEINTVTIAITSDTLTLAGAGSTGSRTLAANGMATAIKIDTTKWIISGSGIT